jgi:molybdenum cofactor cytidylyltransferase
MGRSKAALPWGDVTFLEAILRTLREAGLAPLLVVTSDRPPTDPPEIPAPVTEAARAGAIRLVTNVDWRAGQFSSLRAGVAALPEGVAGAVVALVDQPQVTVDIVRTLADDFVATGAPVVRPTWDGRGGHPIVLGAETFPHIVRQPADSNTAAVIGHFRGRRRDVPAPDDRVLRDFDTPDDLARDSTRLDSPRNDSPR